MTAARLLRVPLAVDCAPEAALLALRGDALPFALVGRWAGGGAIVGSEPVRVARADEDPFALLDDQPALSDPGEAARAAAEGAVGGGWFGWLGYGLGGLVERLPPPPPRPAALPPFQLARYDHVLRRDAAGRWWFEALATPAREAALERRLAQLRERLAGAGRAAGASAERRDARSGPAPAASGFAPPSAPFRIHGPGAAGHAAAVADCRERIAAGDLFQANVCLRFEAPWEGAVDALFATAAPRLEPAYGAAFPAPWGGVASLSPELFLRRRGRAVETAPIKGTIARAGAAEEPAAAAARAALVASEKDHAEHVMIVDLMRNDLGRVCAYGSIEAAPAPAAQAHPGVWHLVSRVAGTLRPEVGDAQLLRATFPPGSVTGAPKVEAMHVVAALESSGRELYTGAIGYASPLQGLELSVAIRTFEARDGRLWLGAGGGIVADSDPARELEECRVKARPLVAAIGAALADDEPGRAAAARPAPPPAPAVAPAALRRGRRRPDPARGIFETLLARDGRPLRLAEHAARLRASAAALGWPAPPADLEARLRDAAARTAGGAAARLRATLAPDGALAVALAPNPPRALPVALAPFVIPGGLGAHKWVDRELLAALSDDVAPATPLLLDGDGTVLEAAWGSVLALEGATLVTPPLDGRILPGVTRAAVLRAAAAEGLAVAEEPLPLARLAAADGILLASAAALAVPARLAGTWGEAPPSPCAAGLLAAALRARLLPAAPAGAARAAPGA